jgi:tetratricopeptide (TPR) repeat protein
MLLATSLIQQYGTLFRLLPCPTRYPKRMSFWRKEVIDFALDHETRRHIDEQLSWVAREPGNARPYCNLAQLYRMNGKHDEALGLLLESVRLDPKHAEAHASLAEIYAIAGDNGAAWKHAKLAEKNGEPRAVELLRRYS